MNIREQLLELAADQERAAERAEAEGEQAKADLAQTKAELEQIESALAVVETSTQDVAVARQWLVTQQSMLSNQVSMQAATVRNAAAAAEPPKAMAAQYRYAASLLGEPEPDKPSFDWGFIETKDGWTVEFPERATGYLEFAGQDYYEIRPGFHLDATDTYVALKDGRYRVRAELNASEL